MIPTIIEEIINIKLKNTGWEIYSNKFNSKKKNKIKILLIIHLDII